MATVKERWKQYNVQQDSGCFQAEWIKTLSVSVEAAFHFVATAQSCYRFFFFGGWASHSLYLILFPFCLAKGYLP